MIRARVHKTTLDITAIDQPIGTHLPIWTYEVYDTGGYTLIARNVATQSHALSEACRHLHDLDTIVHPPDLLATKKVCEPTRSVNRSQ